MQRLYEIKVKEGRIGGWRFRMNKGCQTREKIGTDRFERQAVTENSIRKEF